MTPTDDGDFSKLPAVEAPRRFRWLRWIGVLILVLVIAGAAGWMLRKTVAQQVLAGWCADRELVCKARFDRLGPDGATVGDLTVSGGGDLAFETREIRVHLGWPGLLTPRVTGVEVDAPVVHGELADGRLSFHGLEKLALSGGSGGGALPALDIRDGRILIDTSAGEVSASVSLSGNFPQDGDASLVLDPASLDEKQGYVKWTGGTAELQARNGQIQGRADIALEEVRTDQVSVSNAALTATLDAGLGDDAPAHLVWEGRVDQASGADFSVQDLVTSGQARFDRLAELLPETVLSALTEADVQMETASARWADYTAGTVRVEASLRGKDGAFSGPVELSLADASLPQGRLGQFDAAGQMDWSEEEGAGFSGQVSASNAALDDSLADGALKAVVLPAPLSAHGESLRAALRRALADFSAASRVTVRSGGEGLRIGADEEATLTAASGLSLKVTSHEEKPWLSLAPGQVSLSGNVALKGGGAPGLEADIKSLALDTDGLSVTAGSVRLSPWTVDRVRFGADVSSLMLTKGTDTLAANATGSLSLSGPVFGLDLASSRLSGDIQVTQDARGLMVEPVSQPCLLFETQGVGLGGVEFQPITQKLCAKSGVFMKPSLGQAAGAATLGDVAWPFASKSVAGTLSLRNAGLDWSPKNGFAFTLSSPGLSLPLDIDTRSLTIDAASPRVSLATAKGQLPRLSVTLGDTVLGGTLIPARVSADGITFGGVIGPGGLSGDFAGRSVLIRDFRDDPVYQPLVSDLTARMDEWQLALTGPLRLEANSLRVGDIRADINMLSLDGTAHVETRALDFRVGGLQPVMLSERLRGVYTSAAGQMEAESDVVITGGHISGTADVTVSNFGFQTTRLGRVSNVNGHVQFADLFSLTTAPTQVLTIGSMDPGVPLTDGRIAFRLLEGSDLAVESAAFPFAGGTLALAPFNWTLGADTQHVEVTADAVDLAELVRTLKLPKIEAEGTVSGRFPIDVERTKVLIRNARLFADEGGGRLAYTGDAADSAAKSDANVRMAFEALKDFDFTVLEVGLDGNVADRVTITLKLAGKSRNDISYGNSAHIVRGQPFEFNIGIDTALAELFRSSQYYSNQQKLTDFVVREVLTEKGLTPAENE